MYLQGEQNEAVADNNHITTVGPVEREMKQKKMRNYHMIKLKEQLLDMADFLSKHLTKLEDGPDNTSTINKLVSEIKTFVDDQDTTIESMVQFTKRVTTQVKTQASIQSINYLSNSGWGEVYDMRDII